MIDLSVVIPVYREGEAARRSIEAVARAVADVPNEILVVHDEADDPTVPVVDDVRHRWPTVRALHNTLGRGPALALRAGFRAAQGEAVVVTMADGSDEPDDVPRMLAKLREGYDLVAASRYMTGGRQVGGPWFKKLLSRTAGRSLRLLAGLPTSDATSAFRMYRKSMLDALTLESDAGFEIAIEITVKAHLAGYRIAEIPTTWHDRVEGASSFKLLRWLPRYLRWYALAFTRGRRASRTGAVRHPL